MKKIFWLAVLLALFCQSAAEAQILGSGFKLPDGQHNLTLGSSDKFAFGRYKFAWSRVTDINLVLANNIQGKGITVYSAGFGFQLLQRTGQELFASSDSLVDSTGTDSAEINPEVQKLASSHWDEVALGLHFAISAKVQDAGKNVGTIPTLWYLGFKTPSIKLFDGFYLKPAFNVGVGQTLRFQKLRGTLDNLPITLVFRATKPTWLDLRLEYDLRQEIYSGGISLTLGKPAAAKPSPILAKVSEKFI